MFFLAKPALAQCPVCIVTVGGGMLLAKKLGVDDLLVSIWISALNTAIAFWIAPKLKWKLFKNPYIFSLILLATTLFYFDYTDQLGGLENQILGVDKILLGNLLGMFAIFLGNFLYLFTKTHNNGKALFPYQKVVFPVLAVLIITLVFKFGYSL
jgi:hypothetical protein